MAGENVANDVDEEVYVNDGERHEAQEASAGDRRAIAEILCCEAEGAEPENNPQEPPRHSTANMPRRTRTFSHDEAPVFAIESRCRA